MVGLLAVADVLGVDIAVFVREAVVVGVVVVVVVSVIGASCIVTGR